jgi:hypothetical protein
VRTDTWFSRKPDAKGDDITVDEFVTARGGPFVNSA